MNKIISIAGCGWLGTALGKHLIRKGLKVKGSTRNTESYNKLELTGISTFFMNVKPKSVEIDFYSFFNTDVLIVSIPPQRSDCVEVSYPQKMQQLISEIEKIKIKKVLFISSTSVYPATNAEVYETTTGEPEKSSGKALLAAEKLFTSNSNFETTVVRFGGLIGADRNPARFLSRKNKVAGDTPVNLIHRDDCVHILSKIISDDVWGETFNASCPGHPTRKEFYTKAAKISDLPVPDFSGEPENFKIVNSNKLIAKLNYGFIYNSPMDYLKEIEEWIYRI